MRADRLAPVLLALLLAACGSTPSGDPEPQPDPEPAPAPADVPGGDEPPAQEPPPPADVLEAAIGRLEGLDVPGAPGTWQRSKAVLAEAWSTAEQSANSVKLRQVYEETVLRFRAQADDAFRAFPHGSGRSFFASYPVELDEAEVVQRCIEDVRRALAGGRASGYEAFFNAYDDVLDQATIDALGVDYGAAWLRERCGERAPTPPESVACVAALARFSVGKVPDAARLTLLVVKPAQVAEGAFDFDVDVSGDGLPLPLDTATGLADEATGRLFVVRPAGTRAVLQGSSERAEGKRTVVFDYYLIGAERAWRGRFTAAVSRTFEPPDPQEISDWLKSPHVAPLRDVLAHAARPDVPLQPMAVAKARAEINR
jgi:hypothetical protein